MNTEKFEGHYEGWRTLCGSLSRGWWPLRWRGMCLC